MPWEQEYWNQESRETFFTRQRVMLRWERIMALLAKATAERVWVRWHIMRQAQAMLLMARFQ